MAPKEQDRGLNENPKKAGCVFVLAPMDQHHTPTYQRAVARARELNPGAEVIPDEGLFDGLADWRERWPEVLAPATKIYLLTTEDRTVGRGLFQEWEHLAIERGVPAVALFPPQVPEDPFEEHEDFYLEPVDDLDWKRYAVAVVGDEPGDEDGEAGCWF